MITKHILASLFLVCIISPLAAQQFKQADEYKPADTEFWDPEVEKVDPGESNASPPSDAVVLFGENNLSQWESVEGEDAQWDVTGNYFTVKPGTGAIQTKENFGSFQLHVEWRSPQEIVGESQGRGNSGIFLQGMYEVQVLDSYDNRTYANGQAGSLYKQYPPLVNAMRPPSEWETYDIIYTEPEFDERNGALIEPGYVTVLHNGVVVQNHAKLQGTTEYIGTPKWKAHGDGPIILQDHSNPVSFRNIWIRKL